MGFQHRVPTYSKVEVMSDALNFVVNTVVIQQNLMHQTLPLSETNVNKYGWKWVSKIWKLAIGTKYKEAKYDFKVDSKVK